MSKTNEFIEAFLKSEFANRNLFSHLQAGIPIPIPYKNGFGIRLFFHRIICTSEQISFSAPKFEVCIVYPTGRIFRFTELDENSDNVEYADIPNNKANALRHFYKSCYLECDECLEFFDSHKKITPVVLNKYNDFVKKASEGTGLEIWYGGTE